MYSHDNNNQAKAIFTKLCVKFETLKVKYKEAQYFNDASDDLIDRLSTTYQHKRFKSTAFISEQPSVIVRQFLNSDRKEYTWNNARRSSQSRIAVWLVSRSYLQFILESFHDFVPPYDHNFVAIILVGSEKIYTDYVASGIK